MDELLDLVFEDLTRAHREHLLTESYAQHQALGEFYDAARGALDEFAEAAIGLEVPLPEKPTGTPLTNLETSYVALADMRERVCQGDPGLLTLFDNIMVTYSRSVFKLRRLA